MTGGGRDPERWQYRKKGTVSMQPDDTKAILRAIKTESFIRLTPSLPLSKFQLVAAESFLQRA